jgi:hypothetical protein
LLLIVAVTAIVGTYLLVASHAATKSSHIVDVSWPQCATKTSPGIKVYASRGIVGLNHGKPKTHNPCAKSQAKRIDRYALYVNTAYGKSKHYRPSWSPCPNNTPECWAYNTGYGDGMYDIKAARSLGLHTNQWWIDVEKDTTGQNTGNSWQSRQRLNREYLNGMMLAFASKNTVIGFYTNPSSWSLVTGNWQNGHPGWLATGTRLASGAVSASSHHCGANVSGKVWLVQYLNSDGSLDVNLACSQSFVNNL